MSTSSMGFKSAASMSFRPATWWASDRQREMRWNEAIGGVRWDARRCEAISGVRWADRWREAIDGRREVCLREFWEMRWESDWERNERVTERVTERDERWERLFIILLTSWIKNSFFFFALSYSAHLKIDVHCSWISKIFTYASIAAAWFLYPWN